MRTITFKHYMTMSLGYLQTFVKLRIYSSIKAQCYDVYHGTNNINMKKKAQLTMFRKKT